MSLNSAVRVGVLIHKDPSRTGALRSTSHGDKPTNSVGQEFERVHEARPRMDLITEQFKTSKYSL